jgi:hypothetical protein
MGERPLNDFLSNAVDVGDQHNRWTNLGTVLRHHRDDVQGAA